MSDDFIAGLFARLQLSSASEAADNFNVDTILGDLVSLLLDNPDPDAVETESIRLFRFPELTASISVYREERELWLQFRIGYLNGQACGQVQATDRKNFTSFVRRQQHNPFRTLGGRLVNFADFFVNEVEDAHHRFGADFLLPDVGVNAAADLLDYLLVRCIY